MGKFKHILVSVAVLIVAMVSVAMVTVAMVSRAVLAHIHTCPPPMHAHNMLTVNIPQQKFAELQSCSVASYTNKATMKNSSTHHTHHTHRGTDGFTYLSFQHSTNGETVPEKRAYQE